MGKPRKRTQELSDMAVEMYNSNVSGNIIAKRLGISPPTIYKMLEEAGIKVPGKLDEKPQRQLVKGVDAENVISDYLKGVGWKDLVEKYKFGKHSMKEAIRRAGVKLKDHGGQRRRVYDDEIIEIIRLFESGMNQTAIAFKMKCQQPVVSRILIQKGLRKFGNVTGDSHGSWKGGITKRPDGYILEKVNFGNPYFSMAARSGYVSQHRLRMAEKLGRCLERSETVHHIDGNRENNNIENLQLRQGKHGNGVIMICNCCGSNNIKVTEL